MKVFIDGENLRHQIAAILVDEKKVSAAKKNDSFRYNMRAFLESLLGTSELEINYYTTKIKQPAHDIPKKLTQRIERISGANRKWISQLKNQNIVVIKAGYLRVRESNVCVHCGKKTLGLQEKGVDVRVATDLLLAAQAGNKERIVLISSDSDLVPALVAAKPGRSNITYVCYAGRLNRSVAANADKTVTFDNKDVLSYFKGDTNE